ncbi:MAG: hypothetical protein JWO82_434 [Akkermansiaceae bacterium]|nr:hypothetical protein [Akkermansiaceae bacterium]
MNRLSLLLLPALLTGLPSCTVLLSKTSQALPVVPKGGTARQVHQALGEPAASRKLAPPIPLSKDPTLHRRGISLAALNDHRPVSLREEFTLRGRYRKDGDPDGTGGLAQMSAKAFWIPEIVLGPFATLEWLAHPRQRTQIAVWYSPQGREIFTLVK